MILQPLGVQLTRLGADGRSFHRVEGHTAAVAGLAPRGAEVVDLYLQLEHGEELRSIAFEGRVRLRVDFNAIGPVVAVEPIGGAVVIEAESTHLSQAG